MAETRSIHVADTTETFDEALTRAVQIIEREGFTRPHLEISPTFCYGMEDEEGHWFFTVSVGQEVDGG